MQKVRLYSTLVGKSDAWKRGLSAEPLREFTNDDTFEAVRYTVADQFGDRAIVFVNEDLLRHRVTPYPKFYSAGWFVSHEGTPRELVLVGHGNTMEGAKKEMMDTVQNSDWEIVSKEILLS